MKVFLCLVLAKLVRVLGKLVGKGSSMPGKLALKLCPDVLSRLQLPQHIIAVTGSNGKTSSVEMIARVLTENGRKVVWNKEGSNQIEGVATSLLCAASMRGHVAADVLLLESDERFARLTFRYIKPTVFIITNLYRDQLTRNAHPYRVYDYIKLAVDQIPEATLVLNGDDAIVRRFGLDREKVLYFGMDENSLSSKETDALYNDCFYCPCCKEELSWDYFHYTHLGGYRCHSCGYAKPETTFTVTDMDLEHEHITINGQSIALEFASKYNVYNLCAAFAAASIAGVPQEKIAASLSDFIMKNGRLVRFEAGERQGLLITSKHENSTSYNQSLGYICAQQEPFDLVVLVDAISRKYYTTDSSWLWDISFELLKNSKVEKIYLAGQYAYDLGLRFETADIGPVERIPDLDDLVAYIRQPSDRKLYVVTCFSDKGKLLDRVKVLEPGSK